MAQLFYYYYSTVIVQNYFSIIYNSFIPMSIHLPIHLRYVATSIELKFTFATLNFNCVFRFQRLCTLCAMQRTVYNIGVIQQEI